MIVCVALRHAFLHLRVNIRWSLPANTIPNYAKSDDYYPDCDASDDSEIEGALFLLLSVWANVFIKLRGNRQIVLLLFEIVWKIFTWVERLWRDHLEWSLLGDIEIESVRAVVESLTNTLLILLWQAEIFLEVGK